MPTPPRLTQVPGWVWASFLFVLLYTLHPAADITQYLNAATHWPNPYHDPFVPGTGGGYYGIFLPWSVPLFLPLSWLPLPVATALLRTLTVVALHLLTGRVYWKSGAVLLSFPGFLLVSQGNLDALSAVGALLPGGGALLLLAMKPQAAFLAALPILQRDGWGHLLGPLVVIALSTLLWPEWLYRLSFAGKGFGWWNWSLFPWSLPLAALLLYQAMRRKDPVLAAAASPLVSPFLLPYSLAPALALIFRRWPRVGWALWLLTWVAGVALLRLSLAQGN